MTYFYGTTYFIISAAKSSCYMDMISWTSINTLGFNVSQITTISVYNNQNQTIFIEYLMTQSIFYLRLILAMRKSTRLYLYLPNPSARAGYDTRSIFFFTGLNSEFSFS